MSHDNSLGTTLPFVSKASRYLGNEINAVKKDLAKVSLKVALAFPDVYEVGMSHLGLHILYDVMNARDHIACERVFAPWPDMQTVMRQSGLTLATLESRIPLKSCDILGFSLEYELSYATVLRMLQLAGIPLLARERSREYPLVIAGGPSTYNPEPVADFFDAFIIGEGEDVLPEVCEAYIGWQKRGASRDELFKTLAGFEGVYVPSFFAIEYRTDGTIQEIVPLQNGYTRVIKRVVSDFSAAPFCTSPVVPYMQTVHDRVAVEIARGCSRGCRFCMAGMVYRPVREKSIASIRDLAAKALACTGHDELSLVSLSSGDFSEIGLLLRLLMDDHIHHKVALSFPSLHVATLTRDLMDVIKRVRKTGFTIAPEAGTQRLRDVINKRVTEKEILGTASETFSAGWNLLKLYFMIGLPTENRDDLAGIVDLCRKIASENRQKQINVSVSTFVPKPHTPFQWEAQDPPETVLDKQRYLRGMLQGRRMRLKWHSHHLSTLEGVFSRGDRRLGHVLIEAHRLGAGFESWTEHFRPDIWEQAFDTCGIDKLFYLRKRQPDECLPWAHISCGADQHFLKNELAKALRGLTTPDCRFDSCLSCGVCNSTKTNRELNPREHHHPQPRGRVNEQADRQAINPPDHRHVPEAPAAGDDRRFKYRVSFSKKGPAQYLSHLELSRALSRALRRAELPVRYSAGFHPLPRIMFTEALPVGIESCEETFDVELTQYYCATDLFERMNSTLPEGLKVLSVHEISLKKSPAAATITKYYAVAFPAVGALTLPDPGTIRQRIGEYLKRQKCTMETVRKGGSFPVDLKKCVRAISLSNDGILFVKLEYHNGKTPKVREVVGHILQLDDRQQKGLAIRKLKPESGQ